MTNKYSKAACSNMPGQKLADGGTVGLWERLKAGNIDKEGSEANMRWGSGSKSAAAAEAAPAPAAPAAAPAVSDAPDESPAESARLSRQNDDSGDNYGNEDRRTAPAPAPATPKRRTASAPAKSKTAAGDASPSAAPSPAAYSNEGRRTVSPSPAPAKKGFYASASDNDPNKGMLDRAGAKIKELFSRSASDTNDANYFTPKRTVKADSNFVNGGLIGANTVNTVTPVSSDQAPNSAWSENARGGGRASYGKK